MRELAGSDPALLNADAQVGATDSERVSARGELALMDEAVQRPERNSEVAGGLGRIEPLVLTAAIPRHPASASASHILHAPNQLAGVDVERRSQPGNGVQARIPLPRLQRSDVGAGDAGPVSERLLRNALLLALRPDSIAEQPLARSRSLPGSGHPAIKRLRSIGVDAIGVTLSFSQREGWV